MGESDTTAIDVVAGVIRRDEGPILISLRPQHLDQGGLWEFPGGKREPGESRCDALARELNEELGIRVQRATPLIRLTHHYPRKQVRLDVWDVSDWNGSPRGREGQTIRWVETRALTNFEFPAANDAIITAARIPRLLPMVSAALVSSDGFLTTLGHWLRAGLDRAIVTLPPGIDAGPANAMMSLAAVHGATLHFANVPPDLPLRTGAGRHLDEGDLRDRAESGRPDAPQLSVSVSSVAGFRLAERVGVEWIVVLPEPSPRPGTGEKLADGLQACLDRSKIPAYRYCPFDSARFVDALYSGYQGTVLADGALRRAPNDLLTEFRGYLDAAAYCF